MYRQYRFQLCKRRDWSGNRESRREERSECVASLEARGRAQPRCGRRQSVLFASLSLLLCDGTPNAQGSGAAAAPSTLYDGRNVVGSYEFVNGTDTPIASLSGVPSLRQRVIDRAAGEVLEVAIGSGINIPRYSFAESGRAGLGVSKLIGVDISRAMLARADLRARETSAGSEHGLRSAGRDDGLDASAPSSSSKIELYKADVTKRLPFADHSFDTVIDTFGLCVFDQPINALKEMIRVLRPGGKLLLLEHSRSRKFPLLASYQDLTAPVIASMGHGCIWNQDVQQMIRLAASQSECQKHDSHHSNATSRSNNNDTMSISETYNMNNDCINNEIASYGIAINTIEESLAGLIVSIEATKLAL